MSEPGDRQNYWGGRRKENRGGAIKEKEKKRKERAQPREKKMR